MGWRILVFYFDPDMFKSTNTVIYFDWKTVYLRLRTMSHTIYAVKFEQTIIHQHIHYDGKVSHMNRCMCQ
jgi:hypothetical protein